MNSPAEVIFELGHTVEMSGLWRQLLKLALKFRLNKFRFSYFPRESLNEKLWDFEIDKKATASPKSSDGVLEGHFNEDSAKLLENYWGGRGPVIEIEIFSEENGIILHTNDGLVIMFMFPSETCIGTLFKFLESKKIKHIISIRSKDYYCISNRLRAVDAIPKETVLFDFESNNEALWRNLLEFASELELDTFRLAYACGGHQQGQFLQFEINGPKLPPRGNKVGYSGTIEGRFNKDSTGLFAELYNKRRTFAIYADVFSKSKWAILHLNYAGGITVHFCRKSYLKELKAFLKTKGIKCRISKLYRGVYKITQA